MLLASLGVSLVACGGEVKKASPAGAAQIASASSHTHATILLRGDEDDDDDNSETENPRNPPDGDADRDHDYNENVINGYYDADDTAITHYGHAADATDRQALTAFSKRYYAAAAAGDGAKACSMIKPSFARAIPEVYGRGAGPPYLRGKTCAVVMSLLFKHLHSQMAAPITVSGIRVEGSTARIIVGSPATPVGYLPMEHEGTGWKIVGLIATPLP
ncbi:MAG TPA: hypothetical protein VIJ39_10350 [Solirubrobacteraceae bacterium]